MKKYLVIMLLLVAIFIPGTAMATTYTDDLIPAMTSNTTPSGIASASSEYPSPSYRPAWYAFDNISTGVTNVWETKNVSTGWLAYEFSIPKKICKYTLEISHYFDRAPKNWNFEAWDGSDWVILDTQSDVTDWSTQYKKEYMFDNNTSYKKYRINVLANNGSTLLLIYEMEMMEELIPRPNLSATAGNAQVTLAWDSVSSATSYKIYRSTTSGGPYTDLVPTGVTTTNYTDNDVTNGTTYYYVVTAVNASGESGYSNEESATPTDNELDVPTNLSATAGDAQVNLTWNTVSGATYYNVKRATTSGGPYDTIASSVTSANYTDTSVTNGTTYYYVVTALIDGEESGNSNEASATPQASSSEGRAVLWVTMANGSDIDYDLSMTEVQNFINWYQSKASGGVGAPFYTFSKTPISPYTSRMDYLVFNQIVCWKVNQY